MSYPNIFKHSGSNQQDLHKHSRNLVLFCKIHFLNLQACWPSNKPKRTGVPCNLGVSGKSWTDAAKNLGITNWMYGVNSGTNYQPELVHFLDFWTMSSRRPPWNTSKDLSETIESGNRMGHGSNRPLSAGTSWETWAFWTISRYFK